MSMTLAISKHLAYVRCLNVCVRLLQTSVSHNIAINEDTPRITLPHKISENLERMKRKERSKKHTVLKFRSPPIISCKRQKFNHYKGQTYSNFNPEHLASGGWKHRKSTGDYFILNSFEGNPATHYEERDSTTFGSLGLEDSVISALAHYGITTPTRVQACTIPELLKGKNVLCASETGSGKTLAFLLPMLQRMFEFKRKYGETEQMNHPYGIILTPCKELADQTYNVVKDLATHLNFHVASVCGGRGTQKILRHRPQQLVDVLIATPGVFSKMVTNRIFDLSRLHSMVLDEADTLFDDSFSEMTLRLIRKMNIISEKNVLDTGEVITEGTQVAMVGATMPRGLDDIIGDLIPVETISRVTTNHLNRLLPHVPQKFVRITDFDKPGAVLKVLTENDKKSVPTIVFCNQSNTAAYISFLLEEVGLNHVLFHGNMPEKYRQGRFEHFQSGDVDIMVCTDIASRGLDTIRAQHVINYDFPRFMSDYIHRVGRVGRVGSLGTGYVLSYVSRKWDVDLLWQIEASARRATELYNVNANIKRKLVSRAQEKVKTEVEEETS